MLSTFVGEKMLLQDKVICLTGGSAGIGLECAKAYAAEGAKVCIVALEDDAASMAATVLGTEHLGFACDVSSEAQVKDAVSRTLSHFGRLYAVHNNAGLAAPSKPLHETTDIEWNALFNVNLKSLLHTTRHALPALIASRGCIVNTSSMVGIVGQANHAAYTATKGGMNALTKSMALDYAPQDVRVNAVCPAGVWTPMLRQWAADQPDPAGIGQYLNDIHPLGYCPDGEVIADACVFLTLFRARFITGHTLRVSGGAELGYRVVMRSE